MKMKKMMRAIVLITIVGVLLTGVPVMAAENTTNTTDIVYVHDPRTNAKAMEDIVYDKNAVYGFKPSKDSTRLAEYVDADWSDPVAVEAWKQERIQYLSQFDSMYDIWNEMAAKGSSIEEIAKAVSTKRNEIRLASYKDNPEGLAKVKKSNLDTYGNENGPTPESLFEKYGSWETVLLKSFSSNSGMDACLGLYDIQYEHNKLNQSIIESMIVTYTVKMNDNLSKISKKYFGVQSKWDDIYEANKDQIKDINLIFVGQELIIPIDK